MKEQLEQYLLEFLELVKQTGKFTLEQIPLFLQEYLTYYTIQYGLISFISLVFAIFSAYFLIKTIKEIEKYEGLFLIPLTTLIFFLPFFISNLLVLLKIVFAPRIFIIENLTKLLQ